MQFLHVMASTLAGALLLTANATALTVPFTESFDADNAGWLDLISLPATHVANGGADGGGYISVTTPVQDFGFGGMTVFRCNFPACSGGAFVGDWEAGVDTFLVSLRHNYAQPFSFFARIATQFNFPAYAIESPVVANPGEWTSFSFDIDPGNPLATAEGPFSFSDVFANVGTFQIGVSIPDGFDDMTPVTFDLDLAAVSAVPVPAAAWLFVSGIAGLVLRHRRTS